MSYKHDRYDSHNLHVLQKECSHFNKVVVYDVPTNSLYKVEKEIASKILAYQNGILDESECVSLENFMDGKIGCKPIFSVSHPCWDKTGRLAKLTFHVTSRCNLRCTYCYANYGAFSGYECEDMTPEMATLVLDKLMQSGITEIGIVNFFGGEPLLAIDTIEAICRYFLLLKEKNLIKKIPYYTLISNMIGVNDHIKQIIEKYDIHITASIDGMQKVHDLQRIWPNGTGTFSNVVKSMEMLSKNVDAIEGTYTINHVKQGLSLYDVRQYLSSQFGVAIENVSVIPVTGTPRLEVSSSDIEWTKDERFTNEEYYLLKVLYKKHLQSDLFCNAGYASLSIMPNGDVYPCHMYATNRAFCLGNLARSSMVDIESSLSKLKELPLGSKSTNQQCTYCWARKLCHLCPARACIEGEAKNLLDIRYCAQRLSRIESVLRHSIFE